MKSDASYDVIVIGTGGVGSAALWHAGRRGLRALGLDGRPWAHDQGSSHGQSRIIRMAYFEHHDYVPLLRRAYALWDELEGEAGQPLFHRIGLLQIGPSNGQVLTGVRASAQRHGLDVQWFSADQIAVDFPQLPRPGSLAGVFEADAGLLRVEACVRSHLELACRHGAHWKQSAVRQWKLEGGGVRVLTDDATYSADRLILAPGPWATSLLQVPGLSLTVLEKFLHWFPTDDPRLDMHSLCPAFLYELPDGIFYGFPQVDSAGVKLAEHSGGRCVDRPESAGTTIDPVDRQRVAQFASTFPRLGRDPHQWSRCFYTMSADGHFVVDYHPESHRVVFAAGLSGHGFKFTSVLGEILVHLAVDGQTPHPIGFLGKEGREG